LLEIRVIIIRIPYDRVEGAEDKIVLTLDKLESIASALYFLIKLVSFKSITCPSIEKLKCKLPLIKGIVYQDKIILAFQKVCAPFKILWKSIREI
jgi:hypothetical protein